MVTTPCFLSSPWFSIFAFALASLLLLLLSLLLMAVLLLVTQRHQRIDFRRAARWDVTSNPGHARQNRGNDREGGAISRTNAVKKTRQKPRHDPRRAHSKRNPTDHQSRSLPQHQSEHVRCLSTQSHPDTKFPRPLRNSERHDAIQTYRGQHQRQGCEDADQNCTHSCRIE